MEYKEPEQVQIDKQRATWKLEAEIRADRARVEERTKRAEKEAQQKALEAERAEKEAQQKSLEAERALKEQAEQISKEEAKKAAKDQTRIDALNKKWVTNQGRW